jgi:hypothetical protein
MVLIPLGSACRVRQSIDRYTKTGRETNLFDWNISNFATVVHCIKNIDKPFESSEFYDMNTICPTNHRMVGHHFLRLDSLHDFPIHQTYEEYMPTFLDIYNRRKLRLKNTILHQQKIHFIHFLNINSGPLYVPSIFEICEFYNGLRAINPKTNAHLHLLVHPDHHHRRNEINKLAFVPYIHVHYLNRIGPKIENEDISGLNWNWTTVYDSIPKY